MDCASSDMPPIYESPIEEQAPGFPDTAGGQNAGSKVIVWDAGMSNCPSAWHGASLENYALPEKNGIFLKPSRGTMSLSATFKDVSVTGDAFLGCRLSIQMGRLDCSTAPYNISITSTTITETANSNIPNSNRTHCLANCEATKLLPMVENAYTLGLGRVDVHNNTKTDVQITINLTGGAGTAEPFAGVFLQWIKLEYIELRPRTNTYESLPDVANITIEQQTQISNSIPSAVRSAIRSSATNFPNHDSGTQQQWNFTTGTATPPPPLSLGSRLQRRISIPVRQATLDSPRPARSQSLDIPDVPPPSFTEAVPGARFVAIVRDRSRWRRAGTAILLSRLRDIFLSRLILRFVLLFGDYLCPSSHWLTGGKLLLFWICNTFLFTRYIGRFSSLGGLWTLALVNQGWWKGTGLDAGVFMGLVYVGGVVDGRFLTAEEAAEFEQLMVLESFWRDFFQNLFTPHAQVNRVA